MREIALILLVAGVLLVAVGALTLAWPQVLQRFNLLAGRIIFTDSQLFAARHLSGLIFIVLGLVVVVAVVVYYDAMIGLLGGAWLLVELFRAAGFAAIAIGLLFLMRPMLLIRLQDYTEAVIFHEAKVATSPRLLAILMLLGGSAALYAGLLLWV